MIFILIFLISHWYLSLFCQTFYLHRYAAHKMFEMSPFWEKVFYFLSWLFMGSSYLSPVYYGILHRMHHVYADTENDPHSPLYDDNLFKMMWRTKKIYSGIAKGTFPTEKRFLNDLPRLDWFDKFASSWPSRLFWVIVYILFYVQFATEWYLFALLPIHFAMGPIHGAIINWFAHKYGYTNFKVKDTSKNFLPLDFLMLGESYHNNHHKRSKSPNFGFRWFEFDPTYPTIKLLNLLGVIKITTPKDINAPY